MRFKRFLMAVVCVASLTVFVTGCEDLLSLIDNGEGEEEQTEEQPQGVEEDDEFKPTEYVKQLLVKFNDMTPGIFTYRDGEYTVLIAKGTDGSAFFIPDVTDYFCYYPTTAIKENALPSGFEAFDGDRTHYSFVYGQPMLHNDTYAEWQGLDWTNEMIYKLVDEYPSRDALFAAKGAGTLVVVAGVNASELNKIDDAGNFQETYMKIANRYQTFSHKIGPDKMMPQTTVWKPKGWCFDLYPDEMNTKKHVIQYTGRGDYYYMTVNRWMPTGPNTGVPYPCYVNFVEYIEVYLQNVPEEDARAYIEKVKAEGLITRTQHEEEFTEDVDGKTYQNIWYQADGENLGEAELGHTYFYPGYEVIYMRNGEDFKSLIIKFTTNYTTIV